MRFGRSLFHADRIIGLIVKWVNNAGVTILALMMLLTVADVTLRYFFNKPILGSYEITEFMMAFLAACTIGHAAVLKAHVNVDLLFTKLPERAQSIVSIFTNLICFILFSLMFWRNIYQSFVLQKANSISPALSIPEFPFMFALGVGFGVLALVFLLHLFESLAKAVGKWIP